MKLFWKIYIAVFISFAGIAALISCETSAKQISDTAVLSVLASAALGIMFYFMVGRFARPLENLAESATIMGTGGLNHIVEVQSKDEPGYFTHSFSDTAVQSKESHTHLEEKMQQQVSANAKPEGEAAECKQAEEREAELLAKVENANRELKDFAYIVSHDLKAPLRGIKTLASWLFADYGDKFDTNGKEQMRLLMSRVDRVNKLIDGVLEYSRVGRVKEKPVQVDLNKLIPEVIGMIAPPENITITVENKLPTIEFEPTRITQVFQYLLGNAVKYMDKPQGQIKVGCVENDGFWKFSVADNGPGIEEKHFERIFQMFQTLAPRDNVESTGVGLTITKKIVELYGGRIWVESKVGEGSTFLFTLPKQESGVRDAKLESNIAC